MALFVFETVGSRYFLREFTLSDLDRIAYYLRSGEVNIFIICLHIIIMELLQLVEERDQEVSTFLLNYDSNNVRTHQFIDCSDFLSLSNK